jgi:hypothetical protein
LQQFPQFQTKTIPSTGPHRRRWSLHTTFSVVSSSVFLFFM